METGSPILECSLRFKDRELFKEAYTLFKRDAEINCIQCFPSCTAEHNAEQGCSVPVGAELSVSFGSGDTRKMESFKQKILLVAQVKPIAASYMVDAPLTELQLKSKLDAEYSPLVLAMTVHDADADTSSVDSDGPTSSSVSLQYEFTSTSGWFLDKATSSMEANAQFVVSVTVLVPEDFGADNAASGELLLHPIAYFDSPMFTCSPSGATEGSSGAAEIATGCREFDIATASLLFSTYDRFVTVRKQEKRQLLAASLMDHIAADGFHLGVTDCRFHNSTTDIAKFDDFAASPEDQEELEIELDLVTDDVREALDENTEQCRRQYGWKTHYSTDLVDQTASMMEILCDKSVIDTAIVMIQDHIDHHTPQDERGEVGGSHHDSLDSAVQAASVEEHVEVEMGGTDPTPGDAAETVEPISAESAMQVEADPVAEDGHGPEGGGVAEGGDMVEGGDVAADEVAEVDDQNTHSTPRESDDRFGSFKNIMLMCQEAHCRNDSTPLERRLFSDLLQNMIENGEEIPPKYRSGRRYKATNAFRFFTEVMSDVDPSYTDLVKPFLLPEFPVMGAMKKARRFLQGKGKLVFESTVPSESMNDEARSQRMEGVLSKLPRMHAPDFWNHSTLTGTPSSPPDLLNQELTVPEASPIGEPTVDGEGEDGIPKPLTPSDGVLTDASMQLFFDSIAKVDSDALALLALATDCLEGGEYLTHLKIAEAQVQEEIDTHRRNVQLEREAWEEKCRSRIAHREKMRILAEAPVDDTAPETGSDCEYLEKVFRNGGRALDEGNGSDNSGSEDEEEASSHSRPSHADVASSLQRGGAKKRSSSSADLSTHHDEGNVKKPKRGRSKKSLHAEDIVVAPAVVPAFTGKRGRGRPRKNPLIAPTPRSADPHAPLPDHRMLLAGAGPMGGPVGVPKVRRGRPPGSLSKRGPHRPLEESGPLPRYESSDSLMSLSSGEA
ncbi:hypothetical protein B484DRAFT_30856 [Ochromonadaceae sp. CCMP2298]|nr:hypothetical protein B484DRAFT_30856 [Ochromonadaceae sp. CCMP2298]|mmetsp:Transcript_12907/g.28675  ORF Transcript_12907/g.28675 Transcript_12907/m.28675 type:complete len:953 (+) Transcript_12907:210-3068(+)